MQQPVTLFDVCKVDNIVDIIYFHDEFKIMYIPKGDWVVASISLEQTAEELLPNELEVCMQVLRNRYQTNSFLYTYLTAVAAGTHVSLHDRVRAAQTASIQCPGRNHKSIYELTMYIPVHYKHTGYTICETCMKNG